MEFFYSNYKTSIGPLLHGENILDNEYVIIRDKDTNEVLDRLIWQGKEKGYRNITYEVFDSRHFGKIKPLDVYQ